MSCLRLWCLGLLALVMVACSDDEAPTAPSTGSTFRMSVTSGTNTFSRTWAYSAGMFNTAEQRSYIYGTDIPLAETEQELPAFITIVVPGRSTGTFTIGTTAGSAQMAYSAQANAIITAYAATSGTVTVSRYGAVGGTIEGSFSGTFASLSGAQVSINNGQFSVRRVEDDLYADDDDDESPIDNGSSLTLDLSDVSSIPDPITIRGYGTLQPVDTEQGSITMLVLSGQATVDGNPYSVVATIAPSDDYGYNPGTHQWSAEGASAVNLVFTPLETGSTFIVAANVGQTTITSNTNQSITGTSSGSMIIIRGGEAEPVPSATTSFTIKK
ncbi:MAG: hypothetical protein MUC47_02325 [Candidatus Kapabacteria bacterium]|nr:hypothetical protein [Candidatus Kapabacteria bacterium]